MSPDSVVVEVAVLELAAGEEPASEQFWHGVDEQNLPFELRRRLSRQGLRFGVIGAQVPDWIRHRLQQQSKHLKLDEARGTAMPNDIAVHRRLQCRAGQRRFLPVASVCEQLMLEDPAASSLASREYADCQCQLAVTASPLGDGRVRVELMPSIHHGRPRQRWVGRGGLFHAEVARERAEFEDLSIDAMLSPGQTLVIAASPTAGRLGQAICDGRSDDHARGKLILLRLAQTQLDDLFDPHQTLTPIATLAQ
jgi:hypothetical protein